MLQTEFDYSCRIGNEVVGMPLLNVATLSPYEKLQGFMKYRPREAVRNAFTKETTELFIRILNVCLC
jgi:hypothetical protein